MHDMRISGGTGGPDINHWLVVTVEENLFLRPEMTPQKAGKGNGVELFPLDRTVLQDGCNPVTSIVDTIAKAAGGIF